MATAEQNRRYREKHPERVREQNRRYRERNRERLRAERAGAAPEVNARRRKRYAEDAAVRGRAIARSSARYHGEGGKEAAAAYAKANRRRILARHRERYSGDSVAAQWRREKMDGYRVEWAQRDPEHAAEIARERCQRRRARRRGVKAETIDRRVVFERDEGVCGICGHAVDPANWHLDHVMPLALGGEHSYANVQVSHPRCNQQKGAKVA